MEHEFFFENCTLHSLQKLQVRWLSLVPVLFFGHQRCVDVIDFRELGLRRLARLR